MMAARTTHSHSQRLRRLIPCVLIIVFAVHAVSFTLYLLLQSHYPSPNPAEPEAETRERVRAPSSQKPWPRLPSLLPWTADPSLPPRSCEAYFGNGFSRRVDVLSEGRGGGGWFRCHHSETLGSSICEGARVRLDPALIAMSRGGEPIGQVMGRAEEEELPRYEPGALEVEGVAAGRTGPLVEPGFLDAYVPSDGIGMHTMRALLDSARVVPPGELHCSQVFLLVITDEQQFFFSNLKLLTYI
jgi:glycoprotein 2-beta-D-xylosyltransferase